MMKNLAVTKADLGSLKKDLISGFDKKLNKRFGEQDERFDKRLNKRFAEQDENFDKKLATLEGRFDSKLEEQGDRFERQLEKFKSEFFDKIDPILKEVLASREERLSSPTT